MAACKPSLYSLRLNQVFGSSLCHTRNWYAVSSEWCYRPRELLSPGALFKDDIMEESIYNLVDRNGARVDPSWFGSSRKKDMVVVSTLFGIVAKAVQRNKDVDKVMCSVEFKSIRDLINAFQLNNWREEISFLPKFQFPRRLHLRQSIF